MSGIALLEWVTRGREADVSQWTHRPASGGCVVGYAAGPTRMLLALREVSRDPNGRCDGCH
jgi:hypothetical protein